MKKSVEFDGSEKAKLWWSGCRRLLRVADNGARSLEDPELRAEGREFKSASALVEKALKLSDPRRDPGFKRLSPELRSELGTAYHKFSRDLVRLLEERHEADSNFSEEAEAFLLCLSKKGAADGRRSEQESCCELLPAFANCRKRLRKLSELAALVQEERPGKWGTNVSGKVMLFGASLLAAALLLGGASYFGYPIEKLKEAPSSVYEAGRSALSGLWGTKPEESSSSFSSDGLRDFAKAAKGHLSGAAASAHKKGSDLFRNYAKAAKGRLSGAKAYAREKGNDLLRDYAKTVQGHLSGAAASAHEKGGELLNTFWDKLHSWGPIIIEATTSAADPQG